VIVSHLTIVQMLALRRQANLFRFNALPADQQLPLWMPSGMLPPMIGAIG
jgi:hypothetical protein